MDSDEAMRELRKIAKLLALARIEGMNKGDQARALNAVGFSHAEISDLTGMPEGSVRKQISLGKKKTAEAEA